MRRADGPLRVAGSVSAPGKVRCSIAAGCPRCARGEGCGQDAWFSRGERSVTFELPTGSLPVDAPVALVLPGSRLLRAACLAYGLPLAGLLVGALAGHTVGGDAAAALAAVLGAAGGLILGRVLALRAPAALLPRLDPDSSP